MANATVYDLDDANIRTGGTAITAPKLEHVHRVTVGVPTTTTITATDYPLLIARAGGTLLGFEAAITGTIATGADRTVTVDLKRSTGAGALATVLSATIGFTNGSTLLSLSAATISTTFVADGDVFIAVVTVAGAAGAQAIGLAITLTWREGYA